MAIEIEGNFFRYKKGKPYGASVTIQFESTSDRAYIFFQCSESGWGGTQGSWEEATAQGYQDWKAAAKVGIEYALRQANQTQTGIIVTRILGRDGTDTNPTIVAAAAAYAVWNAIDFRPSKEEEHRLHEIVFDSWNQPLDDLPDF